MACAPPPSKARSAICGPSPASPAAREGDFRAPNNPLDFQGTRRNNGNGHDIHRIGDKQILNFIKAHPQEINLGKVDQIWFLDLVLLKGIEANYSCVRRSRTESHENWAEEVCREESDTVDQSRNPQRNAADAASRIAGRGITLKGAGIPVGFELR
jgi:hypothetical protein